MLLEVFDRFLLFLNSMTDQELYLCWARNMTRHEKEPCPMLERVFLPEMVKEFAARMLSRGTGVIDDDLFRCRFARVAGSSRSVVIIEAKES